ncbi:MAG: trypsin-like peptidase domain-containing protein [Planctomycetaceae bacterium]
MIAGSWGAIRLRTIIGPFLALAMIVPCAPDSLVRAQSPDTNGLAAAAALEKAFEQAIGRAERSVVSIARVRRSSQTIVRTDFNNPFGLDLRNPDSRQERNIPDSPDFIPTEFGSGIIIAPEGKPDERMILTNYHVVRGGPVASPSGPSGEIRLHARFPGGRTCELSIIAADPRSDLAVLKIDFEKLRQKAADLQAIRLRGDAVPLKKGQLVLALGNPYAIARDGSPSASWGMISNISRRPAPLETLADESIMRKETLHHLGTLLHVDARLDLGASGGALIDLKGELAGITTSLAALQGYEKSVGYAIPIDSVMRRIINDLTKGHEVEYGFLGMQPDNAYLDEPARRIPDLGRSTAAKVASIIPGSPAAKAELSREDIILEVNGAPVRNRIDLMRLVGQLPPDTPTKLRVWRSRAQSELTPTVKLGKWPVFDDEGIIATVPRYAAWRGISIDYATGRKKYFDWPHEFNEAVVVTNVAAGSRGRAAGLNEGDFIALVNGRPVGTPGEFEAVVSSLKDEVTLELVGGRRVTVKK